MGPNAPYAQAAKGSVTKTEEEVAGEVDLPSGVSFPHLVRRGFRAFAYIICP